MSTTIKHLVTHIKPTTLATVPLEHLLHKHHSKRHRIITGTFFILTGVFIAKLPHFFDGGFIFAFTADGFGYLLHGAGSLPFLDHFAEVINRR